MKPQILVACEESQAVTKEFRKLGFEAWSCDIQPCSGGHPEWHIRGDVLKVVNGGWAMVLAFPPCTHLASSGARWFAEKRRDGRQQEGIDFFMRFADLDAPHVAIENPVGVMSSVWRKPDQVIQPWQFGHPETKATCLWLKGLPRLTPTDVVSVDPNPQVGNRVHRMAPGPDRAKLRSKTYDGIAKAMAVQWSKCI
jgi:hypothetical protein